MELGGGGCDDGVVYRGYYVFFIQEGSLYYRDVYGQNYNICDFHLK